MAAFEIKLKIINLKKELCELHLRHTGRTTRLADKYIQELYDKPNEWILIKDHYNSVMSDDILVKRIMQRINLEHPSVKIVRKMNKKEVYIKISPHNCEEEKQRQINEIEKQIKKLENTLKDES